MCHSIFQMNTWMWMDGKPGCLFQRNPACIACTGCSRSRSSRSRSGAINNDGIDGNKHVRCLESQTFKVK